MSGFFRLAGDKAGYRSGTVRTGGFTLLEAMIVVLLFSIFSALAIPNSIRFMRNMRLNAAVNGVKKQLQLARMRALADPFKH